MCKACSLYLQRVAYLGFVCTALCSLTELSGENPQIRGLSHLISLFSQGLNFLIPLLDRIRYVQSLKEIVINVPEQSAVTLGKEQLLHPALFLLLRLGQVRDQCGEKCKCPRLLHSALSQGAVSRGNPVGAVCPALLVWIHLARNPFFRCFPVLNHKKKNLCFFKKYFRSG